MLGVGAGPCTPVHGAGSVAPDPDNLSIFPAGHDGLWLDPSDLSTMFQDAAGTIPVASSGDPVRLLLDKSGNGNHVVAASDAARPVYNATGGRHWLEFDGVDDELSTATPLPFSAQIFNCTAFRSLSYNASYPKIVCNRGAAGGDSERHPQIFLRAPNPDTVSASCGSTVRLVSVGSTVTGLDIVVHVLASATESELNANGFLSDGGGVTLTDGSTNPFTISGPFNKANMRFYGTLHVNGTLSDAEILGIRTHFSAKSGGVA